MHNLSALTILPARAGALAPEQARAHLFGDLADDLAGKIEHGDLLVGGENFGVGEGGAAAAAALRAAGIPAVLARSFGEEFARAALDVGLAALVLDAPEGIRTGHTIRVDIDGRRVVDLSSGDRFPLRDLSDEQVARLRELLGDAS